MIKNLMKMKIKKYIYLFAAVSGLTLTACNGMENAPGNQFTDANFWDSPDRAQYVVNMAYAQMYNAGKMWRDESLSDNMIDGRSTTDQRLMRMGQATPSTGIFASEWADLYGGIKTCHVFLENIDAITNLDPAKKARMIAEIRFVRAYIYFRLTNFYGDIPFFTKDITVDESNTISRTSHAEVMAFIHQELNDIIGDLPSRNDLPESENGKITKGAVVALQARAYLMDSDWSNVQKYCEMLINQPETYGSYALFPSYRGLFEEGNEYNQEVILDRAYVRNLLTWGEILDMVPLSKGGRVADRVPQQSLVDSYLTLTGYTIDEAGTDYDANHPYDNRDPRLAATIIYDNYDWSANVGDGSKDEVIHIDPAGDNTVDTYIGTGSNTTATGYYTRKWFAPQATGDMSSGLNIIMFRYADILLMWAEAKLEQNQMTADVWNSTVRAIRQRAGFKTAKALNFPADKSQAELRQILRNERRCELALEGLRWYDIKRWKAGSEYLTQPVRGASFTHDIPWKFTFDENRDYLWAVPQSQIDLNPNLGQNPGYGK
jgi:hypothetical protein